MEAYRKLPRPQAVETIILAHIAYMQNIAYAWVKRNLGHKAVCLEEIGKQALIIERMDKKKEQPDMQQSPEQRYNMEQAGGKKSGRKGGATIGEDLFSIALVKLAEIVPRLREIGTSSGGTIGPAARISWPSLNMRPGTRFTPTSVRSGWTTSGLRPTWRRIRYAPRERHREWCCRMVFVRENLTSREEGRKREGRTCRAGIALRCV